MDGIPKDPCQSAAIGLTLLLLEAVLAIWGNQVVNLNIYTEDL